MSSGPGGFAGADEQALLAGEIDVAVHSLKDLPTTTAAGTTIAAIPRRYEVRDAVCGTTLRGLSSGDRVGTSAPRRIGQLHRSCPGVVAVPIRSNVPPRLRRARERGLAGVLLAAAGLHRLGMGSTSPSTSTPTRGRRLPPRTPSLCRCELRTPPSRRSCQRCMMMHQQRPQGPNGLCSRLWAAGATCLSAPTPPRAQGACV
ncbi:hypothetical protein [Nocardiopsis metallicus]|uniref:hypothetical protein n=1 Tax=Nocardiopsis metallicus TaxID=179819 RepID=UPI001FEA4F23|nr:hypothetical protein [Nocardiopsis metallicus]